MRRNTPLYCYPRCPHEGEEVWPRFSRFATGRGGTQELEDHNADEVVHFRKQVLFGSFYTQIWVEDPRLYDEMRWAVRACVRFRDEFHAKAAEVVKKLGGPGTFNAIHLRRDDWWSMTPDVMDPAGLAERVKEFAPQGVIYVAAKFITKHVQFDSDKSEDQRKVFLTQEKPALIAASNAKVVASEDFFCSVHQQGCTDAKRDKSINFVSPPPLTTSCIDWVGVVEMLICAQASEFMGTMRSTYTNGIQRLHGYYRHSVPELFKPSRSHFTDRQVEDFPVAKPGEYSWNHSPLPWQVEYSEGWLAAETEQSID